MGQTQLNRSCLFGLFNTIHVAGCPEISHHQEGHGYTKIVKGARPLVTCRRFKVVIMIIIILKTE
jgi:hypothetical protein